MVRIGLLDRGCARTVGVGRIRCGVRVSRAGWLLPDGLNLLSQRSVSHPCFDRRWNLWPTRRLAERYGAYVHIQRRAFLVPAEWTKQWMQMIDHLPKRAVKCEYVVLLDRQTLVGERIRLQSMYRFLKARDWSFRYCDLQDVLDSFGGELPTTWNLDVFGGEVVKLQETPAGRYHGGVRLRMAIFDLSHGAELRRMVTCVARFAQPYPAADQAASMAEDREEPLATERES